jgi:cytochrome c553
VRAALSTLLLLLSACMTLPHATDADVVRAKADWPDADLKKLEAARSTYASRCSGCHALYVPSELEPTRWPNAVGKMSRKAKLTPGEREQIERFLVVMAGRPTIAE